MYIDKSVTFKQTAPMVFGSIVDDKLTQGVTRYEPKLKRTHSKFKRTCKKKDNAEQYDIETAFVKASDAAYDAETELIEEQVERVGEDFLVTQEVWDKTEEVVNAIKSAPFWQDGVENSMMQVPMKGTLQGATVCGMADRIDTLSSDDFRYRMIDLKTVSYLKTSTPQKWFHNCKEFGYFRQLALYRYLWAELQGIPLENITCHHAVASWVQDGLVTIKLFTVPEGILNAAFAELEMALSGILAGDFEDEKPTWGGAFNFNALSA